jgi:hypothetical protein
MLSPTLLQLQIADNNPNANTVCILNLHSYLTITRLPHQPKKTKKQKKKKKQFLEESLPVGSSSSSEMTIVSDTLLETPTSAAFCESFPSWKSTKRLLLGVRELSTSTTESTS